MDREQDARWREKWLTPVADGTATMSQRKLTSIDKHGGLAAIRALARKKGVHLVELEDDKGDVLLAASVKPFKIIC